MTSPEKLPDDFEIRFGNPAIRDEIPLCWFGGVRGIPGIYRFSKGARPRNWLELDCRQADRLRTLLFDFVTYSNARHGEQSDDGVPPCWAEHGPLTEEPMKFMIARWQVLNSPHGSAKGAQYWHSYTLPGFYIRLRDWLGDKLLSCQQRRHRDRFDPPLENAGTWVGRTEVIAVSDIDQRYSGEVPLWEEVEGGWIVEVSFLEGRSHPIVVDRAMVGRRAGVNAAQSERPNQGEEKS